MEQPGGRDSRFNLGYSMNLLSGETAPEIYGNPGLGRPSTSLQQLSPRHTMVSSACGNRGGLKSDVCYDDRGMSSQGMTLEGCGVNDISEDTYSSLQSKKSPPSNGKKTKGRVKIKMEYIENKLRRYTTFSKRKTGIMKKAYELSTLTGTQVMLLVASETGHVYTFATRKLQPMITSEAGKALIQTCLNSPDPPVGSAGGEQRMSATGFEETELTYNISDEDSKNEDAEESSSSEDDLEVPEDNSDLPPQIFLPSDPPLFPPTLTDKVLFRDEPTTSVNAESKAILEDTSSPVNNACSESVVKEKPEELNLPKPAETPLFRVPSSNTQERSGASQSFNSLNIDEPINNPSSTAPPNIKAVPLLVQTPAGIGYATLPDGTILGMIEGSPMNQPQLVAIPRNSVASLPAVTTVVPSSSSQSNANQK